ncbi:MAG: Eco57I restriction-modification methylase domain-containing protein [Muribaculaceae bacterium]|nr:Eco57I restriction-modification methylase domain-containing protein [Muribaculaceae bacterium]
MEGALSKIDTAILDNIIVGRLEPYIYAFSSETVPNYLKVGDTSRSVRVRLDEWRKIFPNLVQLYEHSAQIDPNTIFRDFAVHSFLEQEKKRERLLPNTIEGLPYYSREFFKDATVEDVEDAITDIIQSASEKSGKYPLYSPDRLPQTFTYRRTEDFSPRENQQRAIDNFKAAVQAGRTNLLLYAVMRFGKSFTSMCCAKEINARFVVVVSAKADVKEEWKKTVESHKYFNDYHYLDSEALNRNETIITDTLAEPNQKVALFLTLQDLQGDNIKEKHTDVFDRQIDLLIIDETHFGARGESYGKVLRAQQLSKSEINKELKDLDGFETLDRVEDVVKTLNAKIRLHLSGTPYRILMSDEFQKEDIIAFVQFTDIIDAQQEWNEKHLNEDDCEEWQNPYFGFPQMIRFAFNPNESSRQKMEQMRKDGITYAFSELFRPLSMTPQVGNSHRQFKHEAEILDLLGAIDGTKEDENLLGFLDYDKIKDGKMCRHIVCVLPFRASCDAMSALIQENRDRFKNLGDYKIINIAGFDDERKYKTTDDVKRAIQEFEKQDKKTLTLTVNRMLTGTTVPQWDTMLYLKGTASPQEYDQAIFRLQNQYVTTFKDENGKTIKYNMKPQTLLVDFDPNRMFILQELKSQFYNVNTEVQGNTHLKERIAKELEVSPIIIINKNKLQEATPTNITDAVREYSRTRSILDDALDIPADNDLLQDDTLAAILRTIEPIDAKNGLQIKPTEGEGDDIETPNSKETDISKEDPEQSDNPSSNSEQQTEIIETDNLHKRLSAYYARILFFAFLTESIVKSLEDVIAMIPATDDNRRIAHNLGLNIDILNLVQRKSNPFVLQKFDYKIENINDLMRDESLTPIKRVEIAMRKFGRMSDSEVVTPLNVAGEVVKLLPDDVFSHGPILDIASKQGEFTIALLNRYGNAIADKIYSVCTSKLAYEFTRKVYKLLSLPIDHIFDTFTSYDLIKEDNNKKYIIPKVITDMNFAAIIGNPPYQEVKATEKASSNAAFATAIYPSFIEMSREITHKYVSLITPSRWMTKQGQGISDEWVAEMLSRNDIETIHDFPDATICFPTVEIKGGINYFMMTPGYKTRCQFFTHTADGITSTVGELDEIGAGIVVRDAFAKKVISKIINVEGDSYFNTNSFSSMVSPKHYFDRNERLSSNWKGYSRVKDDNHPIKYYLNKNLEKCGYAWINYSDIPKGHKTIDLHKIYIPMAGGTGKDSQILGVPFYGEPNSVCSYTYLVIGYDSEKHNYSYAECQNILKYIKSKFFRYMVSIKKKTQNTTRDLFQFVPMQNFTDCSDIDWSKSEEEIDAQLFAKYSLSDEKSIIDSMIKPM